MFESLTVDYMISIMDGQRGKMWQCTHCGKPSKNRTNLQHHFEANHMKSEADRYACPHCGQKTGTMKAMGKHIYKHHRDKMPSAELGYIP